VDRFLLALFLRVRKLVPGSVERAAQLGYAGGDTLKSFVFQEFSRSTV
jgi:hypothetical protein